MEAGGRRAATVWHRRAGKDSTALNFTATAAHQRIGTYWHMLPEQAQARKVVWDGIDQASRRIIDQVFPPSIRRGKANKQEMKIELQCGSIWQLAGSDNYNSLIGANPVGVVFSEWSVADPAAWDYLRPILRENGGWALFIYTPRGRNHGAKMYEMALTNPDWFAELLTVDHTGIITPEMIRADRAEGMPDEMIEQEYYCSFTAAMLGAYYGKLMESAKVGSVPWEPTLPVQTWWDLGIRDATAIWFVQLAGREIRVIDYYEYSGVGLDHYAKVLKEKPYAYGEPMRAVGGHLVPHDASVRELGAHGKRRIDTMASLGLQARMVPKISVEEGIQAVRNIIPRCRFDKDNCTRGIEALRQYRQEWDTKLQAFKGNPLHDWASNGADAFRYGAVGLAEAPLGRMSAPHGDEPDWRVA